MSKKTKGKDPAFLFYPNDWIGGTMGMTFEEKGAYMQLLMMQFNRGHMTSHMIAQTVGQLWVNLKDKFTQDKQGLWYNERLEEEKQKRKAFTASRFNNLSGKNQYTKNTGHKKGHMSSHMENEDVNVNESINKDENVIEKKKVVLPFDSENFNEQWQVWKDYKKKEHKFNFRSSGSEQASLIELSNLSGGDEAKAIQIIHQSMANGWKGFFEIKNNVNGKTAPKIEWTIDDLR
jgi:uncharacterized protein YdaU (DUF1376 family)